MAADVKSWLARQIAQIDSVQKCVINQAADIVVYSWRGIVVHVHLVNAPLKTRQIKRLLHDATRVGVGSLFIVARELLPPDGARTLPAEWLLALHDLTDEKVYTYHVDASGQPHINLAHFNPTNKADEREIWHGPAVPIIRLPFYRQWIKSPSALKGDWLVAHFGSAPFWRHPDYRSARYHAAQQASARTGDRYDRYTFGYGSGAPHVERDPMGQPGADTRLQQSYALLGLEQSADCGAVKAAFRRLVRECHPDVSSLPKDQAEQRFRAVNEAYTYIREAVRCG